MSNNIITYFPSPGRPGRFLDAAGGLVHHEQMIPFSTGRRVCPGENIAHMELFLYMAKYTPG